MKKIESVVNLRFITPAFIGGEDPYKGPSEFNEKALKGALRFWWRAFCVEPTQSNTELLEKESQIFGGQGSKSKFSLTLIEEKLSNQKDTIDNIPPGIKYLLFSILKRDYISPGSEYSIRIIADNFETMEEVLKSLWLLENFGGLGARSRRGAGSFMVTGISNLDLGNFNNVPTFLFNSQIKNVNEIENFLNQGLQKIKPKIAGLPKYTAYSTTDKYSYFKVRKVNGNGWKNAMNELGQIYSESRSFKKDPYREQASSLHTFAVKGDSSHVEKNPPTKTSFGLPIIYNFKDQLARDKNDRFSIEAKPSNGFTRRASPLFFKIGEVNNNFYIVALVMWAEFLPEGIKIDLIRKQGKYSIISRFQVDQPSNEDIDNFMNTF